MKSLALKAGLTDVDIEGVRETLAVRLRDELDLVVDAAIARTLATPGFERATADQLRPNLTRLARLFVAALHEPTGDPIGAAFREIAVQRARAGIPPRMLFAITDLFEALLWELAARHLADPRDLLAASLCVRKVADASNDVTLDALEQVQREARVEIERLVGQFSAPILPVLPGVLVLPVVGAISSARAARLLDALLSGVTSHAAHTAILDVTGLADADPSLAGHLNRIAGAVRLLGARVVLVGVAPAVAALLVSAGAELGEVAIHATLADALLLAGRDALRR